ncbi:MAG TPA: chromate transporter [Pseudolabrys sp.]|nr:chromate transporter [Pseudolabrys sp.]
MSGQSTLVTLALRFAVLSLFAVGGANAAIPEMHRLAVDLMGWMSDQQFSETYALAQLAPGPNVIVVTLIGYQAAGLAGAAVATLAMVGPTCLLAYGFGRIWDRFKGARWRIAIQNGMVPLSLGLFAAGAYTITRAADHTPIAFLLTATAAGVAFATRLNPLWVFLVAGAVGLAGWV